MTICSHCCHFCNFLLTNSPCLSPPSSPSESSSMMGTSPIMSSSKLLRRSVNEAYAVTTATCTALCCCPLAILHIIFLVFVGYPCCLVIKHVRNCQMARSRDRGRRQSSEEIQRFLDRQEETHDHLEIASTDTNRRKKPAKLLLGSPIDIGGQVMAVHVNLNCCMLQIPVRIRQKIAELKKKKLNLCKWARSHHRTYSIPPGLYEELESPTELESPASPSSPWSPETAYSMEGGAHGCPHSEGPPQMSLAFEHPFWKEHFEGERLGFWRGLSLNECRVHTGFNTSTEFIEVVKREVCYCWEGLC